MNSTTEISLDADVALILFELLARFDETGNFEFQDSTEEWALVRLHGALEERMVEPFDPDYVDLLQSARERIPARVGSEPPLPPLPSSDRTSDS